MSRVELLRSTIRRHLRALGVLLACLGLAGTSLAAASGGAAPDPGAAVVAAAEQHLHDTYAWGGNGPHAWDCSGLTSVLWQTVGGVRSVPRTASAQQAWAVPLPAEQVRPGDLVFFGDPVTHVGLVRSRTTTVVTTRPTPRTGQTTTTTVHMIDASSSRKGVVERDVWTSDTVRYGRVPRPGMVPVSPWTPPTPAPKPTPTATPSATAPTTTAPTITVTAPTATASPAPVAAPGDALRARAARLARGYLGNARLGDVDLVRTAWLRAGGAALPTGRDLLVRSAHEIPAAQARPGDLVVYAAPAGHVGVYLGSGRMVDASRALGKVVVRPVWSSPLLHFYRLPA